VVLRRPTRFTCTPLHLRAHPHPTTTHLTHLLPTVVDVVPFATGLCGSLPGFNTYHYWVSTTHHRPPVRTPRLDITAWWYTTVLSLAGRTRLLDGFLIQRMVGHWCLITGSCEPAPLPPPDVPWLPFTPPDHRPPRGAFAHANAHADTHYTHCFLRDIWFPCHLPAGHSVGGCATVSNTDALFHTLHFLRRAA